MKTDGLDPELLDQASSSENENSTNETQSRILAHDPRLAKYQKMQRAGVPEGAISYCDGARQSRSRFAICQFYS